MEGTIKLPYASPVEALLLSRRNNLGQRVRVPEVVGSLLSEMIRSEVRLAAAFTGDDPRQDHGRRLWNRRHHCRLSTLVAFVGDDPLRGSGPHTCQITDIIANSHYRWSDVLAAIGFYCQASTKMAWQDLPFLWRIMTVSLRRH